MNQRQVFYLTKKGFEKIKKEYNILKNLRLNKIKEGFPKIFESDDINPEYFVVGDDLNLLEIRLARMGNILKNSKIIKSSRKNKKVITLGAKVSVEINGRHRKKFEIVDAPEVNPFLGKISNESIVGKALWGRKLGDKIVVYSSAKTIYTIKKINY